jgi:thiol-disulfide isomerase/thioredoxin
MTRVRIVRWCAVALFGALAALASAAKNESAVAPDFSRTDLGGHGVQLAAYRGKLVLLNFWASWCGPCREEMPLFSQWQRKYAAQGLQVIGVSMDDDVAPAKEFLAKHPVSYPIVMGDAKLGEQFGGVLGLPTTYLIDARGQIVARYRGEANLKKLEADLTARLGKLNSNK